jgi:hypothetical protein
MPIQGVWKLIKLPKTVNDRGVRDFASSKTSLSTRILDKRL